MSRERIDVEQLQELVRLHRMGVGAREVARLLGISPNTERQYRRMLLLNALLEGDPQDLPELEVLRAAVSASLPSATPAQQRSSAEDRHDQIAEALERNVSPKALWAAMAYSLPKPCWQSMMRITCRVKWPMP